jgi:hypothetical protein
MQRSVRATGIGCCVIAVLVLLPSIRIHCLWPAVQISAVSFAAGGLLGLCMAGITRSRSPTVIYLLVLAAASTAWPLYHGWPSAFSWDVLDYDGPVNRAITYLEALRPLMYLLGAPFPYACFGQHGPDPTPDATTRDLEPADPATDSPEDNLI